MSTPAEDVIDAVNEALAAHCPGYLDATVDAETFLRLCRQAFGIDDDGEDSGS